LTLLTGLLCYNSLIDIGIYKVSIKGIIMGLPAWALIKFMADNNGKLKLNFPSKGSLDNPRFTVRDSFAREVASAIS
jgi:hypothetical protein